MVEIVPYKKELLQNFIYDGIEQKLSGSQIQLQVEFYNKLGDCYIGLANGKVIGVGGVYPLWDNTGSLWLFLNQEAKKYKKSVYKVISQCIKQCIIKYNLKMLFAECIDEGQEARRLIQHLGFTEIKKTTIVMYSKRAER